jgi:outer membrane protein assembly factor BamB
MSQISPPLPTPPTSTGSSRWARRAALVTMIVAACFSATVATLMIVEWLAPTVDAYSPSSEMSALRKQYSENRNPGSEKAVRVGSEIRQYDVELRTGFFQRRWSYGTARWLLAFGAVATLLSGHWYRSLAGRMRLPALAPGSPRPDERSAASRGVVAAMTAGVVMCALLVAATLVGHINLAPPEVEPIVLTGQWPAFRGPRMTGVVPSGMWPDRWSARTGENILWKCPIEGQGNSSPVVWGDRVFLTTATDEECWVHCVNAATGRLAWRRKVESLPGVELAEAHEDTGFAAPTPVTDGRGVWVTYANGVTACFDFEGNQRWAISLGKPVSQWGVASSLLLYKDALILQLDQGGDVEAGLSALVVMDKDTGQVLRRVPRSTINGWTTPILAGSEEGLSRAQLIVGGNPYVAAYDPDTFEELWRVDCLGQDVAPSPIAAGGLVFVSISGNKTLAIRPDGSGNVTETHVAWSVEESPSDMPSPVANDQYYLQVTSSGFVVCYRAADGTKLWEHDFGVSMKPSPALVGDVVYLPDESGTTHIFKLADTFELIRACDLGETQTASPAFADGRIYIRTINNLWCIGPKPASAK